MKIFQYLQTKGISRRKVVQLIKDGQIFVDGKKIESISYKLKNGDSLIIKNENMEILKNGEIKVDLDYLNGEKNQNIILFNKPKGYVVSKNDPHNKTIYEVLPEEFKNKYYYIGRLDKDSHGLLVLTDDPKLVNYYEHPSNEIEKEYVVQIDKKISDSDLKKCLAGIIDDGEKLKFKKLKYFPSSGKNYLNIILNEGKKRHIRRVLKYLGYEVLDLQRVREGNWELGSLKIGEFKTVFFKT